MEKVVRKTSLSNLFVNQLCIKGPLFSFDVHEDIRLINDANIEKDEVK